MMTDNAAQLLSTGESQLTLEVELTCAELEVLTQPEAHGHVHYGEWHPVCLSRQEDTS